MKNTNLLTLIALTLTTYNASYLCGAQNRAATHEESKKEKAQEQQSKEIVTLKEQEDSIYRNLYDTLLTLPKELCRLIAQYACRGCMQIKLGQEISCVALLPDNKIVFPAQSFYDEQHCCIYPLSIFNMTQLKEEKKLVGHADPILALATLHNHKLASASRDKTVRIWDINTSQCTYTFSGHKEAVSALAELSKDLLASAGDDGTIQIWNHKVGGEPRHVILFDSEKRTYIMQLIVLSNKTLLAIDSLNQLKVFDVNTGACIRDITTELPIYRATEAQKDSVMLLLNDGQDSQRQVLQRWDSRTGRCLDSRSVVGAESISTKKDVMFSSKTITSLTALPNNTIAFGREDGTIIFCDAITYKRFNKIKAICSKKESTPVTFLAMLPSGHLISSAHDGTKIWFL